MPAIHRDSRFSMSIVPPVEPNYAPSSNSSQTRISYTKRMQRQVINAWKTLTRPRTRQRASFLPRDFVSITSRRRSTMPPQFNYRVRA